MFNMTGTGKTPHRFSFLKTIRLKLRLWDKVLPEFDELFSFWDFVFDAQLSKVYNITHLQ